MTRLHTQARMLKHSIAAIHGEGFEPTLKQLAERAIDLSDTLAAANQPGAVPMSETAFIALEDAQWHAVHALRMRLENYGISHAMQVKLGGIL